MTEKDNLMYLIEEAEELFPSQRELLKLIAAFEGQFGCRPTAILAWNDAYSHIRADWQNVVVQRGNQRIFWRGIEVLRVDAPGDRIILDGGRLDRDWEE